MKKILSLVLALLIMASAGIVCVSAEGANLLNNGDFNTSATGYWWMRGDWNGGTWSYSASDGVDGSGCLIATGAGDGSAACNAGLFYTDTEGNESTFVPVAGEQYQLSFMVNFIDGTSNDVYMDINEGALGSGHANHTGGWEKVSFTFTTNDDSPIKIRCVVNALEAGKRVAVDEIYLVSLSGNHQPDASVTAQSTVDKETQLLGDNLFDNGQFNKASISKWWCRTDWNGGYWTWVDGEGVDGTGCLKAIGAGEGTTACNAGVFYTATEGQENYLQLTEGKTYQVDATFMRPDGVTGALYIDVNEGQCGAGSCTTNGEWESVSFRFVAPADPIKVRIVANALQPGQNVYVDDVMIREVGATPTEAEEETVIDPTIPTIRANIVEEPAVEEPEVAEEEKTSASATPFIIAGAGVVAAIGAAAAVVLTKKKKASKKEDK